MSDNIDQTLDQLDAAAREAEAAVRPPAKSRATLAGVLVFLLSIAVIGTLAYSLARNAYLYQEIGARQVIIDGLHAQLQSEGITPVYDPPAPVDGAGGAAGGAAGVPGHNGQDGATGPAGADGADGSPGVQGQTGPQGDQGTPGLAGQDGKAGQDGATVQGPEGPQGPQGVAGADGRSIVSLTCQPDGAWLVTYSDGSTQTPGGTCVAPPTPTEEP